MPPPLFDIPPTNWQFVAVCPVNDPHGDRFSGRVIDLGDGRCTVASLPMRMAVRGMARYCTPCIGLTWVGGLRLGEEVADHATR